MTYQLHDMLKRQHAVEGRQLKCAGLCKAAIIIIIIIVMQSCWLCQRWWCWCKGWWCWCSQTGPRGRLGVPAMISHLPLDCRLLSATPIALQVQLTTPEMHTVCHVWCICSMFTPPCVSCPYSDTGYWLSMLHSPEDQALTWGQFI